MAGDLEVKVFTLYCYYSLTLTKTPEFTASSAYFNRRSVTSSATYSSPQFEQTRAGIFFITTVVTPRSRVTVVLSGWFLPCLQMRQFILLLYILPFLRIEVFRQQALLSSGSVAVGSLQFHTPFQIQDRGRQAHHI